MRNEKSRMGISLFNFHLSLFIFHFSLLIVGWLITTHAQAEAPPVENKTVTLAAAREAEYTPQEAGPADELLVFTAAGFDQPGVPRVASGPNTGQLQLTVVDQQTGKPTCCRVNVVGPEGNYYQPTDHPLKQYSLNGRWPNSAWGNRLGKPPIRYFGHFFYSDGTDTVTVPAGKVRVEVWKGFEYRPATLTTQIMPGQTGALRLQLTQTVPMQTSGYWSGDPHLHITRSNDQDETRILDLLEAEDVHFGAILAYNEPPGPYAGAMKQMDSPQFRGLGRRSILSRGSYTFVSGQEYRSSPYGHLNLYMLDQLVAKGESFNADHWPPFGLVARTAKKLGGVAVFAHGGYALEVYADVVQDNFDCVELLQFSLYRGIGLIDWYHMLNCGFRVPATGASDYPPCRKMSDCRTYVHVGVAEVNSDPAKTANHNPTTGTPSAKDASTNHSPPAAPPSCDQWMRGMARGQSFFTSGPLLLLEVNDQLPGARITKSGPGPHTLSVRVRVRSEVTPITHVQLIANGRILKEVEVPAAMGQGKWLQFEQSVDLKESAWLAARAYSHSRLGTPDAEAHTNPVYVYIVGRAPYVRPSLDALVDRIQAQLKFQNGRKFPRKADVIAYFNRALDILHEIRIHHGAPAEATPAEAYGQGPVLTDSGARTHTSEQLQAFLQPVPPKPIDEVLNSFETVAGMQMQLIASEPLVVDPVAATFAEQGDLYVCEMRDYPYKPQDGKKPLGTVRLLQDHDGDGVFDRSHLFASELLWPTGIVAWKGGVFVAAAPDIWYLKDTTGDHQADLRRKVFTGFGLKNQQAMVNNLTWGLDHKIYGSTAGNGGTIHRVGKRKPGAAEEAHLFPGVSVDGRDFRFDPVTEQLESITGTIQFGTTFDDWGNRFLCSQSRPGLHVVLPQHYLARNPHLPVPKAIENIAPGSIPVFRISPIEHWRQIRSSRRIAHTQLSASGAGVSQHVVDAAAGVTVYRGDAYGQEFYGNIVVGDAQNNLVHRRRLRPAGVTFKSERTDAQTEFVRSSDNWFRPVNFVNSPDGTLTVLDMSREIIESIHIPLDVVKYLDLTSGRDQGRIYRLAPANFQYPGQPQLDQMDTIDLVATLEKTASWWRDTAHRLIYERQDLSAVVPLRRLLYKSLHPPTRLHALWSLDGLQALTDEDLKRALHDSHPGVRAQALRLAEPQLDTTPELLDRAVELATATEPPVRLQAALTLGESNSPKAITALGKLAILDAADPWIRTAILSSASPFADRLLADCLAQPKFTLTAENNRMLEQLANVVGGRNRQAEIDRTVEALGRLSEAQPETSLSTQLALALGNGLKRAGARLGSSESMSQAAAQFLERLFHQAQQSAFDDSVPLAQRQQAIRVLGCAPWDLVGEKLQGLLDIRQPEPIQQTAIRALSDYANPQIGLLLLEEWNSHSPVVREQIIDCLFERPERTIQFLQAVQRGQTTVAQLNTRRRAQLLRHGDATIRTLAQQLLADAAGAVETGKRSDILARYLTALEVTGDATQGEQIFQKNCLPCHRIGLQGHAVGPDLTTNASRDAAALLANVLDPNRNVLPSYEAYTLIDTNGRTYTGILSSQTATSITLKREENKTDTILRTNIEQLSASGRSLMPEGFEKQITPTDMADLIAFLQSAHRQAAQSEPPLDIGTLPGLVEPE